MSRDDLTRALRAEWRRMIAEGGPHVRHGHESDLKIALRAVGPVDEIDLWDRWWREEGAATMAAAMQSPWPPPTSDEVAA